MANTTSATNNNPLINYFNRDFASLQNDLLNYATNYHGDALKYLNSATPDYFYIQLLAYIGDTLGYQLDKSFNEGFRTSAQQRESLIRIAKDFMFNDFYAKPASTQISLSINIPYLIDSLGNITPDSSYYFTITPGLIVQSTTNAFFECLEEINFGDAINRVIIPNYNSNGILINYTITKTAAVIAGETKIQRFYVSNNYSIPFLEIMINDIEVTKIISVVASAGNTYVLPTDIDFMNYTANNVYVEVSELFKTKIFLPSATNTIPDVTLQNKYIDAGIYYGDWVEKNERFIVRRDKDNNTSIIFGGTLNDYSQWNSTINSTDANNLDNISLTQILNNMSLGVVPDADTTLFIKYRTGAGVKTNAPTGSITAISYKNILQNGSPRSANIYQQVLNSLKITNILPAVGGTNILSNEELRNISGKTFAANDRAVNYEDIKALINTMPPDYGTPFRISYELIEPKLLNYNYLQNYIKQQADKIKNSTNVNERNVLINDMLNWLNSYPQATSLIDNLGNVIDLSQISNSLNAANNIKDNKLWYGEKCRLYVLGIDSNLNPITLQQDPNTLLWSDPNAALKNNIKNYLLTKRIIGDWIDIINADVVNFQIEFSIMADKNNKQTVIVNCLNALKTYFNIYNWNINQAIFIADVQNIIQQIQGVLTINYINFYNIFGLDKTSGRQYQPQEIGLYKNNLPNTGNQQNNRFQMGAVNNIIPSYPSTFFHLRYPDNDIKGICIN